VQSSQSAFKQKEAEVKEEHVAAEEDDTHCKSSMEVEEVIQQQATSIYKHYRLHD